MKEGIRHFSAFASGSLMASCGFYLGYDQWHPMVWSSLVVASVGLIRALMEFGP